MSKSINNCGAHQQILLIEETQVPLQTPMQFPSKLMKTLHNDSTFENRPNTRLLTHIHRRASPIGSIILLQSQQIGVPSRITSPSHSLISTKQKPVFSNPSMIQPEFYSPLDEIHDSEVNCKEIKLINRFVSNEKYADQKPSKISTEHKTGSNIFNNPTDCLDNFKVMKVLHLTSNQSNTSSWMPPADVPEATPTQSSAVSSVKYPSIKSPAKRLNLQENVSTSAGVSNLHYSLKFSQDKKI